MKEKILENKKLFLNFLGVTHNRGVIDKEISELREQFDILILTLEPKIRIKLEDNVNQMMDIIKERYFEYGALVKEVELDYNND